MRQPDRVSAEERCAHGAVLLRLHDGDGNLVRKAAPEGTTLYIGSYLEVSTAVTPPPPLPSPTPQPGLDYKVILPVASNGGAFYIDGHMVPPTKYYLFNGQRVAMRQAYESTVTYLYHDHLGSIVATSDGESTCYWPYGDARTIVAGGVDTSYKYTGQRLDSYINLYQMGSRWYDPALGRFISPDTIVPSPGDPQSLNRYAFVLNNSLR